MSEGDFNDEVDRLAKLHRVFDKYHKFTTNTSEKMIFEILDSENIKWDEVSFISDLPLFIMEEFDNQLDWSALMFNRKMDDEMIKKFENRIKFAMVSGEFLTKITDRHLSVVRIALKANFEMLSDIFTYACSNNYINIVNDLIGLLKNNEKAINDGFKIAYRNNNIKIIRILSKHPNISNQNIDTGFKYAFINNNKSIMKILSLSPFIDPKIVNDGFKKAYVTIVDEITKKLSERPDNKHIPIVKILSLSPLIDPENVKIGFINACEYGYIDLTKCLYKNPNITEEVLNTGFVKAYKKNHKKIVRFLSDMSGIQQPTTSELNNIFKKACKDNTDDVEILSKSHYITSKMINIGIVNASRAGNESLVNILSKNKYFRHKSIENIILDTYGNEYKNNHSDTIKILTKNSTRPHITSKSIEYVFIEACKKVDSSTITLLIKKNNIMLALINKGIDVVQNKDLTKYRTNDQARIKTLIILLQNMRLYKCC